MAARDKDENPEELSVNEGVDELPEEKDVNRDEADGAEEEAGEARADSLKEREEADEPEEEEETAPRNNVDGDETEEEVVQATPGKEHTLDDLAEEEEDLPTGVAPQRPKSFGMDADEEESSFQPRNRSFNSNFPSSGVYTSRGGGKGKRGSLVALLVIALLVIGGSIYLLKSRLNKSAASPEPTLTTIESSSPTPSPSPSIDRTKYKIRVLNGTSTPGLAASVSGKLKDLGYQIDKTGNASNSAFTRTQINSKSGLKELVDALVNDLAPGFDASLAGVLKDSDTADAEVIIGTH